MFSDEIENTINDIMSLKKYTGVIFVKPTYFIAFTNHDNYVDYDLYKSFNESSVHIETYHDFEGVVEQIRYYTT